MTEVTVVGRGTRIRGRVTGAVDLEIHGFVDGEVAVLGDVMVDAQGLVSASISGRRVTVRGAVRGDLTGEDAVVLEDGARVVGDVRAPRVAIAPGALVRGYVQTGGVEAAPRAQAARPALAAVRAPVAKPAAAPKPVARPLPPPVVRVAAPPSALAGMASSHSNSRDSLAASISHPHAREARDGVAAAPVAQRPPPPVVPALKKGAKGAMKKKA